MHVNRAGHVLRLSDAAAALAVHESRMRLVKPRAVNEPFVVKS